MRTATLIFILLFSLFTWSACEGEGGAYPPDAAIDAAPDTVDSAPDSDITDADADAEVDVIQQPECGNYIIEEGEVCDDGNTVTGDGCNASCTLLDGFDFVGNEHTLGDQDSPVLITSDSTVVLIYTDWSASDGGGAGIRARYFGIDGKPLFEIPVNNQITGGNQYSPAAAINSAGDILVTWVNEKTGAGFHAGIRGRVISLSGEGVAPEFQIDESDDGEDLHPSVAAAPGGNFLVVWSATSGEGGSDLTGRFFNAQGLPQMNGVTTSSGEFRIPVATQGLQIRGKLSYVAPDRWILTYEDYSLLSDPDAPGITSQILNLNGTAVAGFSLNSILSSKQAVPTFTTSETQHVACWIDNSLTFDPWVWGVHCRLFSHDFSPLAEEFCVSEHTTTSQINPAVHTTSDGYVVVWEDWSAIDGNGASIRGRRFDATGSFLSGEFGINTTHTGHQTNPRIIATDNGLYWVAWTDGSQNAPDVTGNAIRVRILKESQLSE